MLAVQPGWRSMVKGRAVSAHITARRLPPETYRDNFADIHPLLDRTAALIEADRCHFCYDAPCVEACPTGIDIPGFIKRIAADNIEGAGLKILEANIFGGTCARACPTEILCEQACVRTAQEGKPVRIGRLQRYACDPVMASGRHSFARAATTGKRIAVVGGGPAGLSCAHRLAWLGHDVSVFEARERAGGLNEYGIAEYKLADHFARAEVDFILGIGGIELRTGVRIGRDITLAELRRSFDAVFLGTGLAGVNALGCKGEELEGVHNAIDFIAQLRQSEDLAALPVGRRVVIIGGGNTAIDIAVQTKRLGAEDVTIVYRRGPEVMGATAHEQEFAQINGVKIKHWARPRRILGRDGRVAEIIFEYTQLADGKLTSTSESFVLASDVVFKAIGQHFIVDPVCADGRELLELEAGRIKVDDERRTSLDRVWAGGDCIAGSHDLTVAAVEDGKRAALSIDRALAG
jgi:dihydropyrimidine dehydrogenase (NAD+) subunit PreT